MIKIVFTLLVKNAFVYSNCSLNNPCGAIAPCCSQWGYCGNTLEHCNDKCNRNGSFNGQCKQSEVVGPFDPTKLCSSKNVCPNYAPCCSEFGYCGNTFGHCGIGCNDKGSFQSKCPNDDLPVEKECKPFKIGFKSKISNDFSYEGPYQLIPPYLQLRISKGHTPNPETGILMGYGATMRSKIPFGHGRFTVRMSSATMDGIVTAFVLMSKDKDEIDWEWVGKDNFEPQHNYFYKGQLNYTKGNSTPVKFNTHLELHDYGIEWTEDYISWLIDGKVIRTEKKGDTKDNDGDYKFPVSKMYLLLNLWDAGSGPEGTREWAGGPVDWNNQEYLNNGGFMHSNIESIQYECLEKPKKIL